jgi:hypothetical protein
MSVQKINNDYAIETTCPIVINTAEAIFSYQMASAVVVNKNVNGNPDCNPNEYAYSQIYLSQNATKCCDNNAVKLSNMKNTSMNLYR